jgi:hypothetical protein
VGYSCSQTGGKWHKVACFSHLELISGPLLHIRTRRAHGVATCFLGLFLQLSQYLQAMETNRSALDQFAGRGGKQTHYLLGVCVASLCVWMCRVVSFYNEHAALQFSSFSLGWRGGAEHTNISDSRCCVRDAKEREPLALEAEMKITHLQRAICKAAQRIHTYTFTFWCCKLLRVHQGISISSDKMSSLNASALKLLLSGGFVAVAHAVQFSVRLGLISEPFGCRKNAALTKSQSKRLKELTLWRQGTHHFIRDANRSQNVYEPRCFFIMTWICVSCRGARYIEILSTAWRDIMGN